MTGAYPKRVNMHCAERGHTVLYPGDGRGLNPDETTIAEVLKQKNYAAAIVGKWHLGDQPEFLPTRQGFDYYFGIPYSHDMGPVVMLRNETVIEENPDPHYLTRRYTEEALRFIDFNRQRPFFLYLAHSMPHWTECASEDFTGKSAQGPYGDAVQEIDWSTGMILNKLESLGLSQRTLILFTSDNGGVGGSLSLRGGKWSAWEEGGFRVPLLALWPGRIPAGTVSHEFATQMDILPTLAGIAGVELPHAVIDGIDMWPLLSGHPERRKQYEVFYYYAGGALTALRAKNWKLSLAPPSPAGQTVTRPQLYDLGQDLRESNDLAAAHPEVVARLNDLAQAARQDLGDDWSKISGTNCRASGHVDNPKILAP